MKLIIAYIQPDKLKIAKKVLYDIQVHRISVVDAFGHNDEEKFLETYRGVELEIDLIRKIRLEIALNEEFVKPTIDALLSAGKDGILGDGKIFVVPLENCYRINTGEEGPTAIG